MNINSVSSTPAFRGVIVCKEVDGNKRDIALNTRDILEVGERFDSQGDRTYIGHSTLGGVCVSHKFADVLSAYNLAARNDANVIRVGARHEK